MAEAKRRKRNASAKKRSASKGCLRRMVRWALGVGVLASVLVLVGGAALGLSYQRYVVEEPGPHIERSHIQAIIAQESPVYYRDGVTRIGVFFEDEHREYVPWDALPEAYVIAIVAAEDGRFWHHYGVSLKHIVRALLQDVKARRIVAGGSTLTQQTAKNIYYRPDRSVKSKWTELVNALRLEAHYDKPEILTFYVNQFHVSGNGRGLGIAARYFFDEDVAELSVLECAFLAGLVKAPSYYDPFIGDSERRARSVERAHDRTRYVLQRLLDEPLDNLAGPLPGKPDATAGERLAHARAVKDEAARLLKQEFTLEFKRGTFRYDSSAVLDEVGRRLNEPPFDEVLRQAGIADPDTAGLVVITTLDPDVQRESIYGLWHHLTEVGAMLEEATARDFIREDSKGPRFAPDHPPRRHEFRLAEVVGVLDPTGKVHFKVDLGGHECVVDRDAVVRAALAVHRGKEKNRYAKVPTAEVNAFAGTIPAGATVWVSVREVPETGPALCDLERRPTLQGAVMVVEDGQVRAMVGGNDNRNFNRATALRQMGSTWKPLMYHAALKLGWSPTEELDNGRTVFPFSTTYYYPRPDHTPVPVVSLAWAGVHSENLASIWLLYHLTDPLNSEQIRVMAGALDMARRPEESPTGYRTRVQTMGVLPTTRRIEEGFFFQARQEVGTGLALQGHPEDALPLRSLLYGWGFDAERSRVLRVEPSDRAWKTRALDNNWLTLRERVAPCASQYDQLEAAFRRDQIPARREVPDLNVFVDGEV
ncbi:MAG: transglycosylase domain-containing protein, partial [Deltaproteobacteria bacterium]|nr:transglycosylase domain-containing protein [Deltaproteobacteria bacterium]